MSDSSSLLSQLAHAAVPSSTIALMELAAELQRQGRSVVSLVAGEPDYPTPSPVSAAGIAAIEQGNTRYSATAGTRALRTAIANKLQRENGLSFDYSQIVVSAGTKPLLYAALLAVANPGDEVIVPAPFWVSYPELARMAGLQPVLVAAGPDSGFKLTPALLAQALSDKTRALILNTPNNPSGAVYSQQELAALFEVLRDWPRVTVITDEIYEHLNYHHSGHVSPLQAAGADLQERVILVHGFSKGYGMIGWRLGFAAGPLPLIQAMTGFVSHLAGAPNTISQAAAIAALELPAPHFDGIRQTYQQRRDFLVERIAAIDGLQAQAPAGAFFVFVDLRQLLGRHSAAGTAVDSDTAFCQALLAEAGLAIVPGSAFGLPGFARVSYSVAQADIEAGADRLAQFVASLR